VWPDKPEIAIDPNYDKTHTLYVAFDAVDQDHSESTSSQLITVVNRGGAFLQFGPPEQIRGIDAFPTPAVLADGSVVVSGIADPMLLSDCRDPSVPGNIISDCIVVSQRTNGKWQTPVTVGHFSNVPCETSNNYRAGVIPTLAVGRSPADALAVAWHTTPVINPQGLKQAQLQIAYSRDGGKNFSIKSPPVPMVSTKQNVLPRIAISPEGAVTVLYYEDFLNQSMPLQATLQQATAAGSPTSWASSFPISAAFSPADMQHQTDFEQGPSGYAGQDPNHPGAFIGDYVGLTYDSDGHVLTAWADG
jgi:hypothetical protein